jgi:hypothetical protein
MKKIITISLVLFSLASCRKEGVIPVNNTLTISTAVATAKPDTIPDNAGLGIRLFRDSVNYDGILFNFNHTASLNYIFNEDAPYFLGYGQVSLTSISADGRDLAMNTLPYKPGMEIGLDVHAKTTGIYFLDINYEKKIPADIQIWVKDNYMKDSCNISIQKYSINIIKADTNSFGSKRFKLMFKTSGQ